MRLLLLTAAAALVSCGGAERYARWQSIELSFQGPPSQSLGDPNPFAVRFDVLFRSPGGSTFRVPGFYAGDGAGGPDGGVWRVRFSADLNGRWIYTTESGEPSLDGHKGAFDVIDPDSDAPDFYRWGRLEYNGAPYLKFREGPYWVKAGADDPENILGGAMGDWRSKRGQVAYLARKGINSLYVMTHNLDGDSNDVWPWIGATSEEAKTHPDRFDVAKLQQWRGFFVFLQREGLALYLILEDDSAWTGFDRQAYYREMIARFGDLPALYFNAGEEANESYTLAESIEHMKLLASLDPYNHPRAIHNVRTPRPEYVDAEELSLTSIQTWPTSPEKLNELAIQWAEACLARGKRPLVVNFDEARPAEDRRGFWAAYMGRALWEPIVYAPDRFDVHETLWTELAAARRFVESLPFERMFPANRFLVEGRGFCLAKPGEAYAVYLPEGGSVTLQAPRGAYGVSWFDPRKGEFLEEKAVSSSDIFELAAPDERDWAVRVLAREPHPVPPTAASARAQSLGGAPVELTFALWDAGAPGTYDVEILTPPSQGTLAGFGARRAYTPNSGFTGRDAFTWRAVGEGWTSSAASVEIFANASGENSRPEAEDQVVTVSTDGEALIHLAYTDPDGPGPHFWQIRRAPEHGTVAGADNDVRYTPERGFSGADSFTWTLSDGLSRSRDALVRITVR